MRLLDSEVMERHLLRLKVNLRRRCQLRHPDSCTAPLIQFIRIVPNQRYISRRRRICQGIMIIERRVKMKCRKSWKNCSSLQEELKVRKSISERAIKTMMKIV